MAESTTRSLLFNLIKDDFENYQKYILQGKLFDNLKLKMYDFILLTPSEGNLFLKTFKIDDFDTTYFNRLNSFIDKRLNLETKYNLYLDHPISINDFAIIKESILMHKNMIYLFKNGKHITNLFQRIRNSLAHGNYLIKNSRIILWNTSNKDNISFFMNISLIDFKYLHKKLIELSKK